jgi:hypothetical protein
VGSLAAGIADMILRQTFLEGYVIPHEFGVFLIYFIPCLMGVNVGALILFEQNDAKTKEDKAEKKLLFKIHQEAMDDLEKDSDAIAQEKKAAIYSKMRAQVTGKVDGRYGKAVAYPIHEPAAPRPSFVDRLFSMARGRGKAEPVYNQETTTVLQAAEVKEPEKQNGHQPEGAGGEPNFTQPGKG